MFHRPLFSAFLALGAAALLGACGPSNVEACSTYVEQVNAAYAECNEAPPYDPGTECPESLNSGGSCVALYECMGASYECTGAGVRYDIASCSCSG